MDQVEEFKVKGDELLGKVKEWIHEGNVRHLSIKSSDGRTMLEVPLTLGVVGALVAPVAAALGAVAALVTECTVEVTRDETADESASDEPGAE
jgi:hypothetical protein